MGEAEFGKGMVVEVCSDDQGLRGAWFIATILRSLPRKKRVLVEYHTLTAEKSTRPLKESVDVVNIRPVAPRETARSFSTSDEVDAAHNDGWWEGVVIRVLHNHRYLVYFRTGKEEHVFQRSELRIHREWVHGKWVPPMDEVEEEKATDQLQKMEKQDINTEKNEVASTSGHFMHHLPSDQQLCQHSGKNWHCPSMASLGKMYCKKHQSEQDIYNEKRRTSYTTKQRRFAMDPLLPSGHRQCRRTGKGWHCPEMASLGELYCEKHQLEHNTHNLKKREGKREQKILVGSCCDEIPYLNDYHSPGLKRSRVEEDGKSSGDIRIRCPKKGCGGKNVILYNLCVESGVVDAKTPKLCTQLLSSAVEHRQRFSLHLEVSDSPMNGIGYEPDKNDQTIVELDHRQMLSPTLEEHQACSLGNERSNLLSAEDTYGHNENSHSPNKAGSSFNIEARRKERMVLSSDATTRYSSHMKQSAWPLALANHRGNLNEEAYEGKGLEEPVEMNENNGRLDDSLMTAEREFNDEKHNFDKVNESITRSSIQIQALITHIKTRAEKILEL